MMMAESTIAPMAMAIPPRDMMLEVRCRPNIGRKESRIAIGSVMIATSALLREESRGAHYREDFPHQDPAWFRNICMARQEGGLRSWTVPVLFTRMEPPEALRKPVLL